MRYEIHCFGNVCNGLSLKNPDMICKRGFSVLKRPKVWNWRLPSSEAICSNYVETLLSTFQEIWVGPLSSRCEDPPVGVWGDQMLIKEDQGGAAMRFLRRWRGYLRGRSSRTGTWGSGWVSNSFGNKQLSLRGKKAEQPTAKQTGLNPGIGQHFLCKDCELDCHSSGFWCPQRHQKIVASRSNYSFCPLLSSQVAISNTFLLWLVL